MLGVLAFVVEVKGCANKRACSLIPIGRVREDEKKRMYTYALLNPKDQPYVTFRYIFETKRESSPRAQPPF